MIALRGVSKSFGRIRALDRAGFEAAPGSVVALLGPNGAGKTTAIRVLVGSLMPDEGQAVLAGVDVLRDRTGAQRHLGYLPELASPYPEMTPTEYLHARGRLYGMARGSRRRAIDREAGRCGLDGVMSQRIGTLSKGYRKRTGLAAALLHDPSVLILDEPTDGLDPAQVIEARRLIAELAERRTVLMCTHVLQEVERAAARAVVLVRGRVLADGPPDDLADLAATGNDRHARPGPVWVAEVGLEQSRPRAEELVLTALSLVPGIASVERAPEQVGSSAPGVAEGSTRWLRLRVGGEPGWSPAGVAEAIGWTLARQGVPVRELTRHRRPLEEVFTDLLASDRASAEAPARDAFMREGAGR